MSLHHVHVPTIIPPTMEGCRDFECPHCHGPLREVLKAAVMERGVIKDVTRNDQGSCPGCLGKFKVEGEKLTALPRETLGIFPRFVGRATAESLRRRNRLEEALVSTAYRS